MQSVETQSTPLLNVIAADALLDFENKVQVQQDVDVQRCYLW